ncbi:hypothetical protein NB311A_13086 [Nitrobacter sp. Nb-311A]|nr:hypothetical protein NB311A_13086 [Nitrobacter sp. Nb-311A]
MRRRLSLPQARHLGSNLLQVPGKVRRDIRRARLKALEDEIARLKKLRRPLALGTRRPMPDRANTTSWAAIIRPRLPVRGVPRWNDRKPSNRATPQEVARRVLISGFMHF